MDVNRTDLHTVETMPHINSARSLGFQWLSGLLAVAVCGCSTLGLEKTSIKLPALSKKVPVASADNPAVRVIAIWEPAEGQGVDGRPARGVAGQLMFISRGKQVPVKVDGDVRIYLFDDRGTPEEQAQPIHKFDFSSNAWNSHLHAGALGPAYYVFIPYTRNEDRYQVQCGLKVRLQPEYSGSAVYSELISVTLPGPTRPDDSDTTPAAVVAEPPQSLQAGIAEALAELRQKARQGAPPVTNQAKVMSDTLSVGSFERKGARSRVVPASGQQAAANVTASPEHLEQLEAELRALRIAAAETEPHVTRSPVRPLPIDLPETQPARANPHPALLPVEDGRTAEQADNVGDSAAARRWQAPVRRVSDELPPASVFRRPSSRRATASATIESGLEPHHPLVERPVHPLSDADSGIAEEAPAAEVHPQDADDSDTFFGISKTAKPAPMRHPLVP